MVEIPDEWARHPVPTGHLYGFTLTRDCRAVLRSREAVHLVAEIAKDTFYDCCLLGVPLFIGRGVTLYLSDRSAGVSWAMQPAPAPKPADPAWAKIADELADLRERKHALKAGLDSLVKDCAAFRAACRPMWAPKAEAAETAYREAHARGVGIAGCLDAYNGSPLGDYLSAPKTSEQCCICLKPIGSTPECSRCRAFRPKGCVCKHGSWHPGCPCLSARTQNFLEKTKAFDCSAVHTVGSMLDSIARAGIDIAKAEMLKKLESPVADAAVRAERRRWPVTVRGLADAAKEMAPAFLTLLATLACARFGIDMGAAELIVILGAATAMSAIGTSPVVASVARAVERSIR